MSDVLSVAVISAAVGGASYVLLRAIRDLRVPFRPWRGDATDPGD